MALDWQTFKSSLGLSSNTSVFYIDDEGSKIPIDSEREFQEALRVSLSHCLDCRSQRLSYLLKLARLNKNSLKLIFCGDKFKPNDMVYENRRQFAQSAAAVEKFVELKLKSPVSSSKENVCSCHGDVAPEWFTHYMKKFKKEVVHELKSYIHDTVHSAIEKKLSCTKSEAGELFCERNENPFSPLTTHTRKKKKSSERDLVDLIMDHRQLRLPKKLNATKPERLEMLDQKTKALLEEKRRLLESKRKLDKNCFVTSSRSVFPTKSASFLQKEMCLTMESESEFTITVNMHNDGLCQWRSPQLVCFELEGVCLREYKKYLPKLVPRESCSVDVRGKLTPEEGPHYFNCRVVDREMENISPVFTCRFNVVPKTLATELVKETDEAANQLRDTVGTLIDFEKDLISSSQKKIEENINEIERRLHDIELLQPSTCPGKGKEAKEAADAFQTGCDLIQLENRQVQEDVKNDSAGLATPSGLCNVENDKQRDKIPEGIFCKPSREAETSDSEVSIVFILDEEEEEEDNFFVVPSESLSTSESANEDKKSPKADSNVSPTTTSTTTTTTTEEPTKVRQQPAKPETKRETPRETRRGETAAKETFQSSPTRCRFSPFGEEISKPKKMKSKSTEYCFTTANLTQPTFTHIPGFSEGHPPRFTFTGEKELKSKKSKNSVPDTDALGRTIYAVNSSGRCLPVKELFQGEHKPHRNHVDGREGSQSRQERRSDRLTDNPPVNTIPTALINGASNVASLAFNTAKSVINNLQSAFVTEGKTEMGTPAYEDQAKLSLEEAIIRLCDMGYLDIERNRMLLLRHNKNLAKVVDELVRLNDRVSGERSL